ncbi:MAG TPA: DUF1722 domain-containing protein [Candidatus Binataceae bacterium]|nr:DUF1722 domain-containing protein [Candidatus Binataceae bacterium]
MRARVYRSAEKTRAHRSSHQREASHAWLSSPSSRRDGARRTITLIDDYRSGRVPLVVPITLFRHYVPEFNVAYLNGQVYLEPHPKELMLRNHV